VEVIDDMRVRRWFGLSEAVIDELLLTGRATVTVELDGRVEHIVLTVTGTDGVGLVYQTDQ